MSFLCTPELDFRDRFILPSRKIIRCSQQHHQALLANQGAAPPAIATSVSIAFGSTSSSGGTSGSITVPAGAFIAAHVITGSNVTATPPTVTSSRSDSFTAIGTHTANNGTSSGGNPFRVLAFRCAAAVGGATTFTVNDPHGDFPTLLISCYVNAVYDAVFSAYAVQNGTSPFVSANITTNANVGFLIGTLGSAQNSNPVYTAGNGFAIDVSMLNNASFWTGAILHKAYSGAVTDHTQATSNISVSAQDSTSSTFAIRQAP